MNRSRKDNSAIASGTFDGTGSFKPFPAIDIERIGEQFRDRILAALVAKRLITDDAVAQILVQGTLWIRCSGGDSFTEEELTRFVVRYLQRGPLSLGLCPARESRSFIKARQRIDKREKRIKSPPLTKPQNQRQP